MARVTRSKKIDIAEDHTAIAIQTPLPDTPAKQPEALSELHNTMGATNLNMEEDLVASELKGLKAAYRSAIGGGKRGGKKPQGKKKGKQDSQADTEDAIDSQEPLLDHSGESTFSPVPEATRQLLQSRDASLASLLAKMSGLNLTQASEEPSAGPEPQTKPAARTTRRQMALAQAAEEELSKSMSEPNVKVLAIDSPTTDSSAEDAIEQYHAKGGSAIDTPARSPVKTLEEVEKACALVETARPAEDVGDDSFVKQITCRSPAKPVSRIEDSVEALDELEEALEALDQVALAERMISPEKTRERTPQGKFRDTDSLETRVETKGARKQNGTKGQPPKAGYATMRVKPTAPKHASIVKKATSMTFKPTTAEAVKPQPPARAPVKRPVSLLPPKETTKSTKPPTRPTFELPGEAVSRKLKEQREARLAQRESSDDSFHTARVVSGPKIKSTKPPTKPTFVLPGEAVSQRKREAHEARLKAQEEEERKRREFKARPIRNSIVPDYVPRQTVASLARRSKIGLEGIDLGDLSVSKRSSVVGAHRPSLSQLNMANSSAPRTKAAAPIRRPSPTVHGPSMSGRAMQRSVSVTDVQIQRQRAKEIYNRDNKLTEDIERERREREAAAKRAREEAAERGRQASREWAEKQLAKKIAAGDKGMSAGYGPGGQLGLRP